jgi:pimeloyl-ACP methyl ester carboxylesterase
VGLRVSQVSWISALILGPTMCFAMGGQVNQQQRSLVTSVSGQVVCGFTDMPTVGSLHYCLQPGSSSKVLLFFPGVWNTEYAYQHPIPQALYANLKTFGPAPTVFTMTIGRIAFLTGATRSSGKTDVQEVLDAVSQTLEKHGYGSLASRAGTVDLLGESMGGHNSLMMYLRAPNMFRKFGLECPALSRHSPFIPETDWLANMDADADWYRSVGYKASMSFFFGSDQAWQTASPLHFAAATYKPLAKPGPIFVAHVKTDYFGFNSGGREFERLMRSKGHVVETSETTNVNHCEIQTGPLAHFLAN